MPETTISRHGPIVLSVAIATLGLIGAGLMRARQNERASRWKLLNGAVDILRRSERSVGEALTALSLAEALPNKDWRTAVLDDAEIIRVLLRRTLVEPDTARWVDDAIGHLVSVEQIGEENLKSDLTDWLLRLAAAREQIERLQRGAGRH